MSQITKTDARNYDPALMMGFPVDTNDIGFYFRNAVTAAPGLGISGGASVYSVGNALNFAVLAGTALTFSNSGTTVSTGNTGETTLTGTVTSFGTGSDTGTTAPYAAAVIDAAALHAQLIALTGISITANAAALDAYNAGNGLGVFVPGVYTTSSAIGVTASKTITLNGAGDYVFISTGGAITFGATDTINLINGATAGRVFWVANNAITTGATDTLAGNFISGSAGTITIGATNIIRGRLLGPAAITVDGTATVMSLPTSGSGSVLVASTNTFGVRTQDTLGVPVVAKNMPSLATALLADGVTLAGNLAFDDGTVPATTNCCRMYTFLASVSTTTGAVTLSVVAGNDFPKNRPVNVLTDVNLGDGTRAIVGYLYVKNETSAVFVPNTTVLNTTGITTSFGDGFGFMSYNALS